MTRTERTYYVVVSLYNASWSFIGPLYALFLLGRGLDLFEVNLVLTTFLLTAFLFEVPTGAVADVFGRKISFLLSCLVRSGAFLLYWVSDDLPDFLLAEFVDAIGTTLATGALDAWAVDGMRAEGKEGPTDGMFATAQMLTRAMMIATGITAGYVATLVNIELPWLIAATTFLLTAAVAAWRMDDDRPPGRSLRVALRGARQSLRETIDESWHEVRHHPVMRILCLLTAGGAFTMMPVHHSWQPHVESLAAEGYWLMGWIWAFLNLATVTASWLVPRLPHVSRATILAGATLLRALMLVVAAQSPTLAPAILGLVFFDFGMGLSEPLMLGWMNDHAGSVRRATVLSVRQMAFTLGGAIGLMVLGVVARDHGIPAAWTVGAVVLALVALGFTAMGRPDPQRQSA